MEIEDLLSSPAQVLPRLKAANKKQALQELAKRAAELTGAPDRQIHERHVFDVLLERERLGTTGVGNGIAIPHGTLGDIKKMFGLFARLEPAAVFEACDEQPVVLIFLLRAPVGAGADHLKALARGSRLLRDRSICEKLRGADQAEAIYALLTDRALSHAA